MTNILTRRTVLRQLLGMGGVFSVLRHNASDSTPDLVRNFFTNSGKQEYNVGDWVLCRLYINEGDNLQRNEPDYDYWEYYATQIKQVVCNSESGTKYYFFQKEYSVDKVGKCFVMFGGDIDRVIPSDWTPEDLSSHSWIAHDEILRKLPKNPDFWAIPEFQKALNGEFERAII